MIFFIKSLEVNEDINRIYFNNLFHQWHPDNLNIYKYKYLNEVKDYELNVIKAYEKYEKIKEKILIKKI
jgi:hypothetical protein